MNYLHLALSSTLESQGEKQANFENLSKGRAVELEVDSYTLAKDSDSSVG